MDFSDWARAKGIDPETISSEAKLGLEQAWRADLRAEEERIAFRDAHAGQPEYAGYHPVHDAFNRGGGKLEMLRASRATGPLYPPNGSARGGDGAALLEAGMLLGLGVSEKHVGSWYGERTTDAATQRANRLTSIQGLMRHCMAGKGVSVPAGKFHDGNIRDCFEAERHAGAGGPSTLSLPNILSNIANKVLLAGFLDTPMTWPLWCRVGSNVDFKAAPRYRLTGAGTFQQIAPGGEIKHVGLTEAGTTATLATYGAMIGINRQDIINDDLSAFQSVPRVLSRMAAIKVEKTAVTVLLANVGGTTNGFFSTSHVNYKSGAGSVLADAGLKDAYQLFAEQTDSNGDPIMVPPRLLLVPPILETTALKLIASDTVIGTFTAGTTQPNGNPWAGKFQVIPVPFLSTAFSLTNASQTGWYLVCEPGDYSPVEVNFLNGQRSPTVETAEMDFNQLGLVMRAYHDFSANTLEYRGGVLSAGA